MEIDLSKAIFHIISSTILLFSIDLLTFLTLSERFSENPFFRAIVGPVFHKDDV